TAPDRPPAPADRRGAGGRGAGPRGLPAAPAPGQGRRRVGARAADRLGPGRPVGQPVDRDRQVGVVLRPARQGPALIKYLGSKRALVPVLGEIVATLEARTAVDLFTGTTRVAQEFKRRGVH